MTYHWKHTKPAWIYGAGSAPPTFSNASNKASRVRGTVRVDDCLIEAAALSGTARHSTLPQPMPSLKGCSCRDSVLLPWAYVLRQEPVVRAIMGETHVRTFMGKANIVYHRRYWQ